MKNFRDRRDELWHYYRSARLLRTATMVKNPPQNKKKQTTHPKPTTKNSTSKKSRGKKTVQDPNPAANDSEGSSGIEATVGGPGEVGAADADVE